MRLYMFNDHKLGVAGPNGDLHDVTRFVPEGVCPYHRMTALITSWDSAHDALNELSRRDGPIPLHDVVVGAPQPAPSKIVAAPVNYRAHHAELGGPTGVYRDTTMATIETYAGFCKAPSSVVGPDGTIVLPETERRFDHEGEVGIVVGPRSARNVARRNAYGSVFGFVPLMDITMRGPEDRSFRKSFDTFTPLGPAIVTTEEVPEPQRVSLSLSVNGDVRQSATTADLIFDVPHLIELYSGAMTLAPGMSSPLGRPPESARSNRAILWC